MNTIITTIKFRIFAINTILSLSLLLINSLNATEVYKSKALGMGPDKYKQYSMVRSNSNDGFVYSGTTQYTNNVDVIHIIKTDDNLNTIWSYYYEITSNTLNSTKICKTNDGNGYWISGYRGAGGSYYPFLMQIDNSGSVVDHLFLEQKGVFLDVEPTSDDGCIAVGFQSSYITMEIPPAGMGGRRGLICKFDNTLTLSWHKVFHALNRLQSDLYFFELGENVTVINDAWTSNQDYYFIMGSVSDENGERGTFPTITNYNVPNIYYTLLDNSGNMVYQNTTCINATASDAVYDATNDLIYFIGKWYDGGSAKALIGEIDPNTGITNYIYNFYGDPNEIPNAETIMPHKIQLINDELHILGYLTGFVDNNNVFSNEVEIPFHLVLDRSTLNQVSFVLNHQILSQTDGYQNVEPAFLHSWDNLGSPIISNKVPSVYMPEMGLVFYDSQSQLQWAKIGYIDQVGAPLNIFTLHFMTTLNDECEPIELNIEKAQQPLDSVDLLMVPGIFTTNQLTINSPSMTLDDNNCNP